MSKDNATSPSLWGMFLHELLQGGIYKRTQGRLTRQFTCLAIWLAAAIAAWRTFDTVTWGSVDEWFPGAGFSLAMLLRYLVPAVMLGAGLWLGFRLVNYAPFADFLIAVEAEMNKVTWPSRLEMSRSSIVVIVIMFGLTAIIFSYDWVLRAVLRLLNIVD